MSRLLRTLVVPSGALIPLMHLQLSPCLSEKDTFDTQGFPSHCTNPVKEQAPWPHPLPLAAVGMRRKNFYIMEVDVYKAAMSLSPRALESVKKVNSSKSPSSSSSSSSSSCVDAILESSKGSIPQPAVTVVLHFVRDVDSKKVSEAFNDCFAGLAPEKISNFGKQLSAAIGDGGMKNGEEVMFVWMEGGGLKFIKNGVVGGGVNDSEIERKLLGAYLDPSRAVSPELLSSFNANVNKI